MIELPIYIYASLIAACAALSILLIYFVILSALNKNPRHEKLGHQPQKDSTDPLLNKAQNDYQSIIREATHRAEQIIKDAELSTNTSKVAFDESLRKLIHEQDLVFRRMSDEMTKKYESQVDELNRSNFDLLKSTYKDIIKYSDTTVGVFREELEKETFTARDQAQKSIQAEYNKFEAELSELKKRKLQQVDQNIYKILVAVSKEAIGTSLSFQDHEELIMEALENAKNENIV